MEKGKAIIYDGGNGLTVSCEDYDVEFFGGADYEWTYSLERQDRDRLERALRSEPEVPDGEHRIEVSRVEDEYLVTADHPMTKDHYLSFLAAVSDDGVQLKKLYPEGAPLARFRIEGVRRVYGYCNRHGLFEVKV